MQQVLGPPEVPRAAVSSFASAAAWHQSEMVACVAIHARVAGREGPTAKSRRPGRCSLLFVSATEATCHSTTSASAIGVEPCPDTYPIPGGVATHVAVPVFSLGRGY